MRFSPLALLLVVSLIFVLPLESPAGRKPDDDAKRKAEALAGLLKQPKFYYPTAALLDGLEGHGVCLVRFDAETGRAREVTITQSSGEEDSGSGRGESASGLAH